jgi:DNA-binding beta-propeller fold protein YncE
MPVKRLPTQGPRTQRICRKALLEALRGMGVRVGAAGSIALLAALAGSALAARAATTASYQVLVGDGSTGTVFVIAAGSATATAIPAPVESGVASLAVSPDGSNVYVAFKDGMLGTISTASDSYVGSPLNLGSTSDPGQVVVTPDGSDLYVAETGENQVVEVDPSTDSLVGSPIAIAAPVNLAISPDGNSLFVDGGTQSTSISVIATASNTLNTTTIPLSSAGAMAISSQGTSLYVFSGPSSGPGVTAIDTATDVVGGGVGLPPQSQPADLALAPNGSEVYLPDSADESLYALGMMYFEPPVTSPPPPTGLELGLAPGDVAITPDGSTAYLDGMTSTNGAEVVAVDLATSTLATSVVLPSGAQPSGLVIAQVAPTSTPTPSPTPTASPTCSPLPIIPFGPGPVSVPPNQPVPASSPSAGASFGGSATGSVAGSTPGPTTTASPTATSSSSEVTSPPAGINVPTPIATPSPSFCCGSGTGTIGGPTTGGPISDPTSGAATPPGVALPPAGASAPDPGATSSPAPTTPTPSPSTAQPPILCFAPVIAGRVPGAAALTSGLADPTSRGPLLPVALALLGLGGVGVVVGARRRGFRIRRGAAG